MNAGFNISPEDVPAQVMEAILLLENELNKYKKKKQKEIERTMEVQTRGV